MSRRATGFSGQQQDVAALLAATPSVPTGPMVQQLGHAAMAPQLLPPGTPAPGQASNGLVPEPGPPGPHTPMATVPGAPAPEPPAALKPYLTHMI
jgi:hypothetical protein